MIDAPRASPRAARRSLLDRVGDWAAFIAAPLDEHERAAIRADERTGHPLGATALRQAQGRPFIKRLERRPGRPLARQKPGPKPCDGVR
jgi:hypothetical protein